MSQFDLRIKKQPSGLQTVLLPRTEGETVTFLVLIGVGSRYETPRQAGLSHFLEHMFFKGTQMRPTAKEIAEDLDNVGGEFNAFTGEEYTGYYVKVASKHLEHAADVVADILLRSKFPAEEIERERGVIIEEIRMYTDTPMRHIAHLWNAAMYGDHPLGRRIDGSIATVSSFARRDFLGYTSKHYHTGNAVVAVAGNFDPAAVEKLLAKLFADLPKGAATVPRTAPKKMPQQRLVHEWRKSLDQTHLIIGVPGVSLRDERRWAAELLAAILGGGMSSRLFISVRERNGLAYAIRTSNDTYTDTGSFATQAGVRTDKAEQATALILAEYDQVMKDGVTAQELAKAKEMMRGGMLLHLEETNALAVFCGSQAILEGGIQTPDEILAHIARSGPSTASPRTPRDGPAGAAEEGDGLC
jgi:predicted Zn-dependent peptidase